MTYRISTWIGGLGVRVSRGGSRRPQDQTKRLEKTMIRWKQVTMNGSLTYWTVKTEIGYAEIHKGRFGWAYRINKLNETISGKVLTRIAASRIVRRNLTEA